jgi:glycosyltransferase involved in cell wall biosynthesis
MRGRADLAAWGAEALRGARAVIAGSEHIREVLAEICGPVARVHSVPPGVDIELWHPEKRDVALRALLAEARRDPPNPGNADDRLPDDGNAARLEAFLAGERPTVVYYGKLIRNKGVHVLLEALRGLDARAVIVGFGDYRAELERQAAGVDALFTGMLEHRHLVHLVALADASAVPSVFPEAFGMVAAESAAAGCPPVVADHSGLAEVGQGLEADYPPALRALVRFPSGDAEALRTRLSGIFALAPADRAALREAARRAAAQRWSWGSVAERILAAALGS